MSHCEILAVLLSTANVHHLHATPNLEQRECTDELAVYFCQKCDFFLLSGGGWILR